MEFRIEETTLTGEAIDLRERAVGADTAVGSETNTAVGSETIADPDDVLAAIRGGPSPYEADCADPGPLHERVRVVEPEMAVRARTVLAAAARSRGLSAPQDDRIEALRDDRDAVEIPAVPAPPDAPPAEDVTRLRERVAALRGEVQALESAGHDPTEARERLHDAAGRLAELETERAARQQATEQLRAVRDARERRLRIADELANVERAARAHLVAELRPDFEAAVADLANAGDPPATDESLPADDPFDAPPDAVALAVLRVGAVDAPVVVRVDRFPSPHAAADWLDAPVIRL